MNNQIEKFINDNRGALDDATPSGKVWDNVEAALKGRKERKIILAPILKWSAAAAVLLLVGLGAYFIISKNKPGETNTVSAQIDTTNTITVADAPEVNVIAHMIVEKQEELRTLGKDQPELYQKFTADITQLDSSYRALKNQLGASPNREMLLEAMIQNLQLQLNVLNEQLNIIHQIKQSKNYSHEKIDQPI